MFGLPAYSHYATTGLAVVAAAVQSISIANSAPRWTHARMDPSADVLDTETARRCAGEHTKLRQIVAVARRRLVRCRGASTLTLHNLQVSESTQQVANPRVYGGCFAQRFWAAQERAW